MGTPKVSQNDSVGTWSSKKLIFNKKWVPEQFTKQHPVRIFFNFNDSEDAEYFEQKFFNGMERKIELMSHKNGLTNILCDHLTIFPTQILKCF